MASAVPPQQAVFWLWPEHAGALRLWADLSTQWRVAVGMSAAWPLGLDYSAAEAYLRVEGIRGQERRERFAELRVMERTALRVWAEERAREG